MMVKKAGKDNIFFRVPRPCPAGHVCIPGLGSNPNFGFTNFDTFPWSMLTTFQLITLDYWENIYNMVSQQRQPSVFFSKH